MRGAGAGSCSCAPATTSFESPANAHITATSTTPAIAWIEADPGNPTDGSLLDADFVPSVRGVTYDTEWTFRTNVATATGFVSRRSDLDAIAFADGTVVLLFALGAATPLSTSAPMMMVRPHPRWAPPGHLLVASSPILLPRPLTGEAKPR